MIYVTWSIFTSVKNVVHQNEGKTYVPELQYMLLFLARKHVTRNLTTSFRYRKIFVEGACIYANRTEVRKNVSKLIIKSQHRRLDMGT